MPLERVTVPDALSGGTPGGTRTGAEKDPKKVEAGRKGAAARKAKQEKLLAELRETKASLVPKVVALSPGPKGISTGEPPQHDVTTNWTPWVVGGVALAGTVYLLHCRGATTMPLAIGRSTMQQPPRPSKPSATTQQLNVSADPFYMK